MILATNTPATEPHVATETRAETRRLRNASLAFHIGSALLAGFPALNLLGLTIFHGVHWPYPVTAILIWLWGAVVLARDPRLKLLMPFGSRTKREALAHSPARKVVLDEFDFHLRGEAFRISYEVVATLVAAVATAGVFLNIGGVPVEWGVVLGFTCPFGILWLLGLPTSVVVWLSNPAAEVD